jgi:hypothetical protein
MTVAARRNETMACKFRLGEDGDIATSIRAFTE